MLENFVQILRYYLNSVCDRMPVTNFEMNVERKIL